MSFPNYPEKHNLRAVFTAQDMVVYRSQLGRLPKAPGLENVLICLQRGLPERRRVRWRHSYRPAGRLMGDLYLLKKSGGKTAVLTNIGIGAPQVASLVEELIALGARRLVLMSLAGGLQPDLNAGEVVVCERAIRDEGVSHHYLPPAKHIQANPELVQELVAALTRRGLKHTVGASWSTAATYRETEAEIRQYQTEGVKTVEMEAAALFAVCQCRGVQAASIHVVGDSLAEYRWQAPRDVNPIERALEAVYDVAIEVLG
jgi:uridine phosphorylase